MKVTVAGKTFTVEMQEVESTNLAAVGYRNKRLVVTFRTGQTYAYRNVPRATFDGLLNAGSMGGFFATNIRTSFKYQKLT